MAVETAAIAAVLVAPMLLTAGAAKLVAPQGARDSFTSLAPSLATVTTAATVRLVAAAEIAAGVLLLVPQTHRIGAVAALAFGIAFAVLGIWGAQSASSISCGCFGSGSERPLGYNNVAVGVVVLALSWTALSGHVVQSSDAASRDLASAALLTLLLAFAVFRSLLPVRVLGLFGSETAT